MPRFATPILILLVVTAATTACREDHDGKLSPAYESYRVDVATYLGQDSEGAAFELVARDDNGSTTLHAPGFEPKNETPGRRVLLSYAPTAKRQDASITISVNASTRIGNDSLRVNTNPLDTYRQHPIKLKSIWRTGEFINLHGQLEQTKKEQALYLMADNSTLSNDTVHAYVVHDMLDNTELLYWRDFYSSVNIGALIKRNTCRTLRVHINDEAAKSNAVHDFTLKK